MPKIIEFGLRRAQVLMSGSVVSIGLLLLSIPPHPLPRIPRIHFCVYLWRACLSVAVCAHMDYLLCAVLCFDLPE